MADDFFDRLRAYYENAAAVLRGESNAASIFPNSTDLGQSREKLYLEFLRLHAPAKCRTFLGGYLFDENGNESRQLDVIVTTDTSPKFDLHNKDGGGKSFAPVEGTLGVISSKTNLTKANLVDALDGLASIPPTGSLEGRKNPAIKIFDYDDWPYKLVFALDGPTIETTMSNIDDHYRERQDVPIGRRVNMVHVLGKYVIYKANGRMGTFDPGTQASRTPPAGEWIGLTASPDVQAIVWTLDALQGHATMSNHVNFNYAQIYNKVLGRR